MLQDITSTFASLVLAIAGFGLGSGASTNTVTVASAQTSTITDPVGDTHKSPQANRNEAYFDIVQAEVSKDFGEFTMTMRVAAPIPLAPPNPPGIDGRFVWLFFLDTQDGRISGFPFPSSKGTSRPFEYIVQLTWDGQEFASEVIDRTPLLTGGNAVITPVPVSFNPTRDELTFTVDPNLIGNPSKFGWNVLTSLRDGHEGTEGAHQIDAATGGSWPGSTN